MICAATNCRRTIYMGNRGQWRKRWNLQFHRLGVKANNGNAVKRTPWAIRARRWAPALLNFAVYFPADQCGNAKGHFGSTGWIALLLLGR
jgi:hypothetical protein